MCLPSVCRRLSIAVNTAQLINTAVRSVSEESSAVSEDKTEAKDGLELWPRPGEFENLSFHSLKSAVLTFMNMMGAENVKMFLVHEPGRASCGSVVQERDITRFHWCTGHVFYMQARMSAEQRLVSAHAGSSLFSLLHHLDILILGISTFCCCISLFFFVFIFFYWDASHLTLKTTG